MNRTIVATKRASRILYKTFAGITPLLLLHFLVVVFVVSSSSLIRGSAAFTFGSSFTAVSTSKGKDCFQSRSVSIMSATRKPSGSFFNKVPDNNKDRNDDNENGDDNNTTMRSDTKEDSSSSSKEDPFEQSLQQLIKSRSSKPRASSPSTLGGIPTSKVKGK